MMTGAQVRLVPQPIQATNRRPHAPSTPTLHSVSQIAKVSLPLMGRLRSPIPKSFSTYLRVIEVTTKGGMALATSLMKAMDQEISLEILVYKAPPSPLEAATSKSSMPKLSSRR